MHRWLRPLLTKAVSAPRVFPSSGFNIIPPSQRLEEETLAWYSPKTFYPVRIGQLFQSRYQAISKLGFGSSATVWLCRDLKDHKYVALKVCIPEYPSIPRELAAFQRFVTLNVPANIVQRCFDEFTIVGEEGSTHQCFVLEPLTFSVASVARLLPDEKWDVDNFRQTARGILHALNFLHAEAKLIHCDLRQENFLMQIESDSFFQAIEERELKTPSPRKTDGGREIYVSHLPVMPMEFTYAVLCDFGEARPGDMEEPHVGDIQPFPYRAPEILLDIPFSYPADIWNAGVMLWHMFEGKSLFHPYTKMNVESDLAHFRDMIALMGLPPPYLLKRSTRPEAVGTIFDESGKWKRKIVIPEMTLESVETRLQNEEKAEFLRFIRRFLQWDPEMRATAAELYDDPWLKRS